MKVNDLIIVLQKIKKESGNVEVMIQRYDGKYYYRPLRTVRVPSQEQKQQVILSD